MIRDPGPLHNLGYSVTSRDIPTNEGETEGDAPNSGYVTRALNGHPIMRFFATTAATVVGTAVASKLTKSGGIRLAKFLQKQADDGSQISTRIVKSVGQIRRELDELQGVSRQVDGVTDPYSKIIFEQDGKYVTGYDGIKSERFGFQYLTEQDKRISGSGLLSETPAVWSYRDELQVRLIRAGRRLPYELPAMYGVQKAITEPLFGERNEGERKVKWYNPVDVIGDFAKQSITNVATMILPFEFAGAAATTARSSLHTYRYSMNDMKNLTPGKQKAYNTFTDLSEVLAQVGHDFATLTNKFLKTSAQTSGGFAAAAEVYKQETGGGFVQNLYSLRRGMQKAKEAAAKSGASRSDIRKVQFSTLFKGFEETPVGSLSPEKYKSISDLIPTFNGIRAASQTGYNEFKLLGKGFDAMENSIAFNRVLSGMKGLPEDNAKILSGAINRIQSQHSSRLSSLASGIRILGGGGPENSGFRSSEFYRGEQVSAFKDLLEQQIISRGVSARDARDFVEHLRIRPPRSNMHSTNIITIGKTKIYEEGATAEELSDDFFSNILKRYKGIIRGSSFEEALGGKNAANALKKSVEDARDVFASREFRKSLDNKIRNNWNSFYRNDLSTVGSGILKPKKAMYQDFVGPLTEAKQEFLQRKTAEVLGINLVKQNGMELSNKEVLNALRRKGFDPNQFTDLRAFLIKNRQMTSGVMAGGFNLFGLQSMTIDEARESGRFAFMRPEEQAIINNIANRMAINDPVSKSIGLSRLDGVYKTKGGQVLDFTSIKSSFSGIGNFFASEFKIPILGFNPADLFGYRSFSEMSKRSPIQYISGRSVQPFLGEADKQNRADFYIWFKTKGSKGKLLAYGRNDFSDEVYGELLKGTYRALPTSSTDLLTRHARYSSGAEGKTPDEIRGRTGSRFLNAMLGAGGQRPDRAIRFKRMMSIDTEQPNSLFGLVSRFANRSRDLNNPSVMARLLSGEEVSYNVRGVRKTIKLDPNNMQVIDEAGQVVDDFSTSDILRAFDGFRKSTFTYGLPTPVVKELEKRSESLFTYGGKKVSEISTASEAVKFAEEILAGQQMLAQRLRSMGIDSRFLATSQSRIKNLMNDSNLMSISQMAEKSPTITTRLDELKHEIFRYISQVNQVQQATGDDIFIHMQKAIDDLVRTGKISPSQRVEAQAAALSTMFNISAFRTYSHSVSNIENAKTAATKMMDTLASSREARTLLDPLAEGSISQISSGGIRKKFSPILSPIKRKFGVGPYELDDMAVDPLGSGQSTTLVPTFGTVFGESPFGAISSALGFGTYKNPQYFSTGSIPMSQGVERLNRYFGTLGMQLDVSDFGGPLDLFARGMVQKRVLPMYAAGVTALTVDRTLGGMVNERDERGERVYSPLVLGQVAKGAVELQSLSAGITPGGMSYQEKKEQLVEGEVPIRQGRFWPLGNTPFQGGKVMYYRPSWYRKLQGGAMFTSDTYGSPMEKFLYYNDISPLRPFDPYRFEREHYYDRPYPVTGEYFSGPFGPLVPFANMTIGKILKPQKRMHEQEVIAGLSSYAPAGESGAYDTSAYGGSFTGYSPTSGGAAFTGYGSGVAATNAQLASRAGAMNTAGVMTRDSISNINSQYIQMAYGPPKVSGVMTPRVVAAGQPIAPSNLTIQGGELAYRMQEMAGIYGFGFASTREFLGFGQGDYEPQRSVLQSASKAYGTTRAFWDLNLGGLGDIPLPTREAVGNIEFSEIVRRFIPKERTNVDYINPIQNLMGMQYPFLPGSEYFTDFTRGDPFTKVQEGELRLPGVAYERFNKLYSDSTGRYGAVNQLDILADVAPYSQQFKRLNRTIDNMNLSAEERIKVSEIREQVANTTKKYQFSEYKYKGSSAEEMAQHPFRFAAGRIGEYIAHSDNFVASKMFGKRTALEDWERRNVYGTTFPEWQRPYESYIQPMLNKATQGNPIVEAATLGFVGSMFGRTPRAKLFGTAIGIMAGAGSSLYGMGYEAITGERFVPAERKKELALEEYADILTYVKNTSLANTAQQAGDSKAAMQFRMAAKRTMYGADIYGSDVETLSLAIPKRKREHFKAMIDAPESERGRILSTAGRLERRIYEAAWGMEVEKRPDLEEYFSRHELPDASWEGWHPNTNIDSIKIKMGQSMGLEMSQMGYYPQQIREANLLNPSYPQFGARSDRQDVMAKLRSMMSGMGLTGSVNMSMNPFGSDNMNISAGVR